MNRHVLMMASAIACLAVADMGSAQPASPVAAKTTTPAALGAAAPAGDSPDAIFAHWDTNHDKSLSLAEFRAGWESLEGAAATQRLHAQFVLLDLDKNGCMNAAEYSHMALVERAGKSAPPFSTFDQQRNQCLDFKEYVAVVKALLAHDKK